MTVILEKRDLPVVSVIFAVKTGGIYEKKGEKGISHFIEHLLYKGTLSRTNKEIAEEIEKKGGVMNGFTGEAVTGFWSKIPSKNMKFVLDVLSDMVKNPLFDENELNKERKVIFEEIKMYKDNPRLHVMEEIQKLLYDEPFGIPILGTYESMGSLDREKIVKRFNEVYTSENMVLVVVGNANFSEIVSFIEKNFSPRKEKKIAFKVKLKNAEKIEKRKAIDQANLVFAYHVPSSDDKKSYAAEILGVLMTEGMSSRLWMEIREKRNLAYTILGGSDVTKHFGHTIIRIGTMKENVEKVKKLILKEFETVSNDLTEEELNKVKEQVIGHHQISMEDSQDQMLNLLMSELDGNAKTFYEFEKNILDVKLKDVKALAKKATKKYSFYALVPE